MKKEIIKPFDLAKAKAGAKLRTKDGKSVEIFRWDARGKYPIKGIVEKPASDLSMEWNLKGERLDSSWSEFNLVIVEEVEESKFKVGDWIANGCNTLKVLEIKGNFYVCENKIAEWYVTHKDADVNYHLWTIQDVKDGDVLSWDDSKCIAIFRNIYNKDSFNSYGFVGGCTGTFESRTAYHDIKGAHPATKEQRELLFSKLTEAGYEWDAEKLELKKIKPEFWSDDKRKTLDGFYININSDILKAVKVPNTEDSYDVFATKKQAKSALAMARISQIMANDIENFGGVITDEEWLNDEPKFAIDRYDNRINTTSIMRNGYDFLAFHTAKQRDLFLKKYPQLVKDYLMIPDE